MIVIVIVRIRAVVLIPCNGQGHRQFQTVPSRSLVVRHGKSKRLIFRLVVKIRQGGKGK